MRLDIYHHHERAPHEHTYVPLERVTRPCMGGSTASNYLYLDGKYVNPVAETLQILFCRGCGGVQEILLEYSYPDDRAAE